MNRLEAWQRHLLRWLPPLVFCLLGLAGLLVYRAGYAGKVDSLTESLDQLRTERTNLEKERGDSEAFLGRIAERRRQLEVLYDQQFSTPAERFTRALAEIKRLAREAGLRPDRYSYPEEKIPSWGLIRRRVIFSVDGTYEQLRTFINFIELSDQFLTLERISLNESSDRSQNPILSIQLDLSTVFVDGPAPAAPVGEPES